MDETCAQQFTNEKTHAARRMEMVHVRRAVGIDAREQRHLVRKLCKIIPGQFDPRRRRHGNEMHGVVGGTTCGQQTHDAIHNHFCIDLMPHAVSAVFVL